MNNICYSGGAEGADQFWGILALNYNHNLIHWSFGKHRKNYNFIGGECTYILSQNELNLADPCLIKANYILKRQFPTKSLYVNNLLRRNYYQISTSNSVYAVSNIVNNEISGGTAWAVQMFININIDNNEFNPLYVLNQIDDIWYEYDYYSETWTISKDIPCPSGIWTGIGTRNLLESSKNKMLDLFEN